MKTTSWLKAVVSVGIVSLVYLFSQTGCQPSRHHVRKAEPSPPKTSVMEGVQVSKQKLSMAEELKDRVPTEYILGPEDTVEVSVFGQEDLKMEVSVSSTGRLPYYLIGDVQAAGLTQFQLRDKIQTELRRYIKDPKVVVRITEYKSHKVFILGQVKNPGVYRMKNNYTLLEAISSAGGITPDAYLGGAYLVRDGEILLVNFFDLIKRGNTEENIPLASGDIIYIPDRNEHKVYVLGEVNKQAAIPIQEGLTLIRAITEAGGFTYDANKKSILVLRGNLSEPEIMTVDAKRIFSEADPVRNIPVQHGDIVYVPSSKIADVERFAIRLSNILEPYLQVARGVVLTDVAIDILKGEEAVQRVIVR
jgi:polysaccharide export outer membrane protein